MTKNRQTVLSGLQVTLRDRLAAFQGTADMEASGPVLAGRIGEISQALSRIHEGDYGCCVDCGRDIPLARLEAMPQAVRCISCQERHEQAGLPSRRAPPWQGASGPVTAGQRPHRGRA